jgi:hypothetical protein
VLGTLWVVAHWRIAAFLDHLDGSWDPPSFLDPVERLVLVMVGVAASLVLVTGVQWLFRRALARRLAGVDPRRQVLLFIVPVLVCLLASWRFRVMVVGPALLLGLNLVQLARNLPPSTPATEALGWFGRTGARVGKASWRVAGRVRDRRTAKHDEPAPPF